MEAIKFTISGKSAFFKNPVYSGITGQDGELQFFSFNNIHRINILGILGATIGLSGYSRGKQSLKLPDFYQKLKDLEISIVPNAQVGFFTTTKVKCNNSSKLATTISTTLNYTQNWLINPSWNIYIKYSNNKYYEIIKDYLINSKTEFTRYLGANSHLANISEVEVVDIQKIDSFNGTINSLFCTDEKLQCRSLLSEKYPIALSKESFYKYQTLFFTKNNVQDIKNIFTVSSGENIYFIESEVINESDNIEEEELIKEKEIVNDDSIIIESNNKINMQTKRISNTFNNKISQKHS